MMTGIKVSMTDPGVKAVVKAAFPEYRGRKITVRPITHPVDVRSYWDGGSRDYFVVVDMKTGRSMGVPQNGTPFDGGPIRPGGVEVPVGFAIVEHTIFCGKDAGITIHVHPDTMTKMIPAEVA